MGRFWRVLFCFLGGLAISGAAQAGTFALNDDFDGPSLDPVWTVNFDRHNHNAEGWTSFFESGAFVVTEIDPISTDLTYSIAVLEASLPSAGDFSFDLDIGWSSVGLSDRKNLMFSVYDDSNHLVGRVSHHDAWQFATGRYVARSRDNTYRVETTPGSLELADRATFSLARTDGTVSLSVDGSEMLSFYYAASAGRLAIEFTRFNPPEATFDRFFVYDLEGSYSAVPLPPAALGGLGLLGFLAGLRRVRRYRARR